MKLAEALLERKALKQKIATLVERLMEDARVAEGDRPAEEPMEILAQVEELIGLHGVLIERINLTNQAASLAGGKTIMRAIAERDMLNHRLLVLNKLMAAAVTRDRYGRNEIKYVPAVDVAEVRKMADRVSKELRELDAAIQAANWEAELA